MPLYYSSVSIISVSVVHNLQLTYNQNYEEMPNYITPGVPKVWSHGPPNYTKSGTIVVTKCNNRWKNH